MALEDYQLPPGAMPQETSLEEEMILQDRRRVGVEEEPPLDGAEAAEAKPEEDAIDKLIRWGNPEEIVNIAEELEDTVIAEIGMRVIEETAIDERSREEWLRQGKDALNMTLQRTTEKTFPWAKASNVLYPLMTQAADQFAARAYPAIIENRNVVKGVVSGDDSGETQKMPTGQDMIDPATKQPVYSVQPGEKAKRADRIADHMSWQLIEEQTEWEGETDTLLSILPIMGCAFRKVYYDPDLGRNVATLVPAERMIINYWAKSMETAPRLTEEISLYPYEIRERVASGYFLPGDYLANGVSQDRDAPHILYEQHRRLDLDGDGYPEPYIVTVHKDSMKVCRIVARFDIQEGALKLNAKTGKVAKILPVHYYTKYDFMPNKEGGIYGQGFGQLLFPINNAVNSTLNQLIDAGTLQNTGGGFIGKGLSMHSGNLSFRLGEWKMVNAIGSSIRDSVVPLQHAGPSPVLFNLLGMLIEAGKDISSVKDVLAGELKAQTMSPTVFMALVEQGLKVFTSIYKRVHRSLKDEFEKLYRLNRLYLDDQVGYQVGNQWKKVTREDYQLGSGVDPISDPTMVVDAQRMARTQVLAEFKDDPLCNGKEIRKRIFEAASIADVDKVLAGDPAPNPEVILKMAELELKATKNKVDVLEGLSRIFKNMADADTKIMEPFMQWQQLQLTGIKNEYDAINSATANATSAAKLQPNGQPGAPAGGAGVPPGGVPGMEAPPDDQGGLSVSGGPPARPDMGP